MRFRTFQYCLFAEFSFPFDKPSTKNDFANYSLYHVIEHPHEYTCLFLALIFIPSFQILGYVRVEINAINFVEIVSEVDKTAGIAMSWDFANKKASSKNVITSMYYFASVF